MESPKAFFCPSEQDPRSMLGTPENPWPPGPDGDPNIQGYCGYGCRPEVNIPDVAAPGTSSALPKLAAFKNKAIFADLTATPQRVDTRHIEGINVLFGDGSAEWIQRSTFDADLKLCLAISPANNEAQRRLWEALDR
jgi:prepilin-type processing-associated H-X9-DG protein